MTLVSLSHHCLGPNVCSSIPDSGTLFTHFMGTCSATAGLVIMGDSLLPNMQSHVLSPFNCLSQRANSLFNFLGIMEQLSMYPGVLLLLESVFKKNQLSLYVSLTIGKDTIFFEVLRGFLFRWLDIEMGPVPLWCYLIHIGKAVFVLLLPVYLGTVGLLLLWERKLMWTWKSHWEPSI